LSPFNIAKDHCKNRLSKFEKEMGFFPFFKFEYLDCWDFIWILCLRYGMYELIYLG